MRNSYLPWPELTQNCSESVCDSKQKLMCLLLNMTLRTGVIMAGSECVLIVFKCIIIMSDCLQRIIKSCIFIFNPKIERQSSNTDVIIGHDLFQRSDQFCVFYFTFHNYTDSTINKTRTTQLIPQDVIHVIFFVFAHVRLSAHTHCIYMFLRPVFAFSFFICCVVAGQNSVQLRCRQLWHGRWRCNIFFWYCRHIFNAASHGFIVLRFCICFHV